MKKRNTRNFGACEDRMLQAIDRKRAVLAAVDERCTSCMSARRPCDCAVQTQEAMIALFALECEGVLHYPALSQDN